jgi:maltose-binding protein MalE
MYSRSCRIFALFVVILALVACNSSASENTELRGPILVWHPQIEGQEEVLDELLARFTAIYPEVAVVRKAYSEEELKRTFEVEAELGMGPTLLIGSSLWVPDYAEKGLIQNLSSRDDVDASTYLSTAIRTLRYTPNQSSETGLYGLPFSLQTFVLFYNKNLVDTPPSTLSALLDQAADGKKVALDTRFSAAFWGIQAFGGQLLDEEGQVVLNRGGFANWLSWLKNAQTEPNIILNNNEEVLFNLFQTGEVAYYIGLSSRLPVLQGTLGKDVVGVAPLPAGPNSNPAGPFMITQAFMFNSASSPAQLQRTLRLAQFLTNVEQQTTLALQGGLVPANPEVRVDPRVSPAVASIVAQTKTAVPALNIPQVFDVVDYGDDIYVKALAGEISLNEAATELSRRVNSENGFETIEATSNISCGAGGTLQVWHSWSESEAIALQQIARTFMDLCPIVSIELSGSDREELFDRYRKAAILSQGPDLLIIDNQFVSSLAAAGLVSDLTNDVGSEFLQRYVPGAQETMRYKGKLYGLPVSMESMALYYNADLVTDPARDLTDLLNQATPERQVILQIDFYRAYWGVPAFGGRMFDTEDRVALNRGGFAEWLSWLRAAQDQPGIVLTNDREDALTLFAQGKAAYLAGEKWMLNPLQAHLGPNKIGVVPLPAGPKGESGPFLVVMGALLKQTSGSQERELALEFAKYLTSLESQRLLMERANLVPANVTVNTTAYPAIGGFLEQARTAFVPPNDQAEQVLTMMEQGQKIYADVLEGDQAPSEAVNDFVRSINKIQQLESKN